MSNTKKPYRCLNVFLGWGGGAALTFATMIAVAAEAPETRLEEISVIATRAERREAETPATVTSITRDEIDRRLPADEADLFDDEPGVVMPRDLRRHGASRVNIRGIEDNRVQMLVDGVRLPDYRNGGGPTNLTVNTPLPPNTEFLKRVEILRGPASSLYGSDALGGVVGFLTLDPSDLLAEDERAAVRYRASVFGVDESYANTLFVAGQGESVEALVGFTRRDGHELGNHGERDVVGFDRTAPNPQDYRRTGWLAKVGTKPTGGRKLTFTLEGTDEDTFTDVKRLIASLPRVTSMQADDTGKRTRATLAWEQRPASSWYDRLTARLYRQQSETFTRTRQNRTNTSASCSAVAGGANNCYVELDYDFTQVLTGVGLQAESGLRAWGGEHLLTVGADLARTETEERRDGRVWNTTTGTFTKSLAGEAFPVRDFAPGYQDALGLFVQDEIAFGRLVLVPGLRYDAIKLNAEPDALTFQHAGHPAVDKSESAFSPKFAVRWQLTPVTAAWAQVARGFRAPNYEEVNGSFRNSAQLYGTIPNPDLEPETSTGVELGLKMDTGSVQTQLVVFDNRYKDFIETKALNCPGDPNCVTGLNTTFQSINIDRVRIHGAEARAAWRFAPGWKTSAALAYARGDNETDGVPLNSIEPLRAQLALARTAGNRGAELRVNAASKVGRVDNTQLSSGEWFKPGSWTTVDLATWWYPAKNARLGLALNNVFDEEYRLWGDVRLAGLTTTDPGPEFYTQPGRNVAASFSYQF